MVNYNLYHDASLTGDAAKSQFTTMIVDKLLAYPNDQIADIYNVAVFRTAAETYAETDIRLCSLNNGGFYTKYQVEGSWYTIALVQDGSLELNGNDGGYQNWAMGGPSVHRAAGQTFATFGVGCA